MGTPTVIHVNRHVVTKNRRNGIHEPPLSVRHGRSGRATYAHRVQIIDAEGNTIASVISRPDKPLKCGATVWIETEAVVLTQCYERALDEPAARSKDSREDDTGDCKEPLEGEDVQQVLGIDNTQEPARSTDAVCLCHTDG